MTITRRLLNSWSSIGGLGLAAEQAKEGWEVVELRPGGWAEEAGIRIGDRITAVETVDVTHFGLSIFIGQLLRGPSQLDVVRGGATVRIPR